MPPDRRRKLGQHRIDHQTVCRPVPGEQATLLQVAPRRREGER
jgi:hypothetical protein